MFEYNPRLKRIYKQNLSSGRVVTATQANNNAWIITHLGAGEVNKGSICVVKGNGWFMTKAEQDRRLENARRRFNSSLENQVGSQEYNAMRNELNSYRNNIKNWVENTKYMFVLLYYYCALTKAFITNLMVNMLTVC